LKCHTDPNYFILLAQEYLSGGLIKARNQMHRLVEYFRLIVCVKGRNTGLFGNVCLEKLQGRVEEMK
jgi:hypothetical protein